MSGCKRGRNVIVTGGTVRLGKAIAEYLRASGWNVVTVSHREDSGAEVIADFRKLEEVEAAYRAAVRLFDGNAPDGLVNNAALYRGDPGEIESVNLKSPILLTELMATRCEGRGAVVNILDAGVGSAQDPYGEAKSALADYTREAARRFVGKLRVNAVAPGPVYAPVQIHEKAGECPLGRPTGEAVARAVEFLLAAEATSGIVIPVDGGKTLL